MAKMIPKLLFRPMQQEFRVTLQGRNTAESPNFLCALAI